MGNQDDEGVEPKDRDDTHEPTDSEDSKESNLLTHSNLQGPDDSNGEEGDEKIGHDVDAGVHIPNPMTRLELHVAGLKSLVTLTFCCLYTSKSAAQESSSRRG